MIKVSLSQLIENIDHPEMIGAVLSLYEDWLMADDGYALENLIPVLNKKLRAATSVFSEIISNQRNFVFLAEKMADKSADVITHSAGLTAIATAHYQDSAMAREIYEMEKTVVLLCRELESFMRQTIEQQFEMQSSNFFAVGDSLGKLNAMLSTRHFDETWAKEKLHAIHSDIQKNADTVCVYQLQPCILAFYKDYRDCAERAETVHRKLLKLKDENQMVSGEMLTECSELTAQLEKLGMLILKAAQAANQLDLLNLKMSAYFNVYLLVSSKRELKKPNFSDLA